MGVHKPGCSQMKKTFFGRLRLVMVPEFTTHKRSRLARCILWLGLHVHPRKYPLVN